MAFLELASLAKSFGDVRVLRDITLSIDEGETLVLLGPSGSGKTTLLRLIAGFETADAGEVKVGGRSVGGLPPAERNLGMVFQHYALFPHLSVGENVAFGLESRRRPKEEIASTVERALAQVDLAGYTGRRIDAISGGQQQRVALARALAPEPELLLLDEPLSNLDPELRERTRQDLAATLSRIGITAVWVTHEQEEAFDVGTRVAVLNQGRLEQIGHSEDLYRRPATPFVASFVGRASVLRGRLLEEGLVEVAVPGGEPVRFEVFDNGAEPAAEVDIYIRPEAWQLSEGASSDGFSGTVVGRRFAGRDNIVRLGLESGAEIEVTTERDLAVGDKARAHIRSDSVRPTAFALGRDPA
ncbi:MAG: ABC transporter ATP-binding protein [Thermoanaerobaculia bacterium]